MGSYRTILVGTDGSDSSFRAVDAAARLSADAEATLVLVTAYHPMSERERLSAADRLGDLAYKVQGATPAEDALRAARERAVAAGATAIEEVAVQGDAVDVLAKVAKERGADLVVVGNRGLNSLAGRILGSVPANLSHRAPCDILIVHTTDGK
ncbi:MULTISPECIES: universal stress protein [Thermomonospora]|uniref:Nucleotide-binding universal stress UspA family protein n=1 Tax=Thermomonospora cellulosilytica TaxID=1411118 RepID=A0A7W3RB90_9ACTN|nr:MULTISPECIES: universal stress protein [Thermomonospora]MBA9006060.1 nucleotide-binding universal stress UspA family protein [Thermomonospora cellulosilytica]